MSNAAPSYSFTGQCGPQSGNDDHPRRCQGIVRLSRERCCKFAMHGSKFCRSHGGIHARKMMRATNDPGVAVYRKYLSKTLQERLDECSEDITRLTALHDELEITRLTVVDVVRYYDAVASSEDSRITLEVKTVAGKMLRDAVADVAKMAEIVERMEQASRDKVSLKVLGTFVEQVVRAIYKACEHEGIGDETTAKRIEKYLREHVNLPASENEQNIQRALPPAEIAAAMDDVTMNGVEEGELEQGVNDEEEHEES